MTFEYMEVKTMMAQIEVDDIGNCAILSRNDLGEEKYLVINTQLGLTQVVEYGPIVPDIDELPLYVNYNYQRFDYNEYKIEKMIRKFVSQATQVELTDIEYVKENMRDLISVLEEEI